MMVVANVYKHCKTNLDCLSDHLLKLGNELNAYTKVNRDIQSFLILGGAKVSWCLDVIQSNILSLASSQSV